MNDVREHRKQYPALKERLGQAAVDKAADRFDFPDDSTLLYSPPLEPARLAPAQCDVMPARQLGCLPVANAPLKRRGIECSNSDWPEGSLAERQGGGFSFGESARSDCSAPRVGPHWSEFIVAAIAEICRSLNLI